MWGEDSLTGTVVDLVGRAYGGWLGVDDLKDCLTSGLRNVFEFLCCLFLRVAVLWLPLVGWKDNHKYNKDDIPMSVRW